nr:hypothetical protein [uncultured Actinotalea sp.]
MTTRTQDPRLAIGTAGVVAGTLALAAVGWLAFLTWTSSDVPEWLRISGSTLLPLGLFSAAAAALLAPTGPARRRARTGLVLAAAAVLALTLLLLTEG